MPSNTVYKEEWRVKDRARAKKWYQDNKHRPEVVQRIRDNSKNKKAEQQMLATAKSKCKKLGIPFDLELSDIVIPPVCPVLGTEFVRGTMQGPSLDRLDPNAGYTKGNVFVISRKANTIKNYGTASEHERIAEWMREVGAL